MTPITLRVAELRKAKGMSQAELAELAGIRRATLHAIEKGTTRRIDFDVLEKLANALAVDPAYLIVNAPASGSGAGAKPKTTPRKKRR